MSFYNTSNYYNSTFDSTDWSDIDTTQYDPDTAKYLFDSPQPEPQPLPDERRGDESAHAFSPGLFMQTQNANGRPMTALHASSQASGQKPGSGHSVHFTVPSSSSDGSEQSDSPDPQMDRRKRQSKVKKEDTAMDSEPPSSAFKMDDYPLDNSMYPYDEDNMPLMGQGLDNLSLGSRQQHQSLRDFGHAGEGQDFAMAMDPQRFSRSNMLTVQPSQTTISRTISREDSPILASQDSSPGVFGNTASPLSAAGETMSGVLHHPAPRSVPAALIKKNSSTSSLKRVAQNAAKSKPAASDEVPDFVKNWPCRLSIGPTPDKSRVETQIPIELVLHNLPPQVTKIHLPSHTISKPKFQCKPVYTPSPDTLELTAMLVCASAMQKDGVISLAYERAAKDEIFVDSEENQPASAKGHVEDDDPIKPLNGGPVAICSGCITRERKRAARKKTKKQDEEEEWAKDEAKRIIVFNCPEVRDWCVPDSSISVKDSEEPVTIAQVKAPMRIACYCRHQSEKIGFRVLFTLRTHDNRVLGQAMSQSIMITDDHKQPANHGASLSMTQETPNSPDFSKSQLISDVTQNLPFRTSYSTNDLTAYNRNHYAPQRHPPMLSRRSSGLNGVAVSHSATTPRNLSRPASPTNENGPTKKRRAGSGHAKVPSGLAMTRLDSTFGQQNGLGGVNGHVPSNYTFSAGGYGYQAQSPNSITSTPTTPLHGSGLNLASFGNHIDPADAYQFFSAPTSQHTSRAPSPVASMRPGLQQHLSNMEQPPSALSRLPPGFNLQRPPIIQRVIPNLGHVNGGEDITILGTGFFHGLEVYFGDAASPHQEFWSDSTLVCKAPPSADERQVAVVFKHQHPQYSRELLQLRTIMPTTQVLYTYLDDDRQQMQQLAMGMTNQSLGR